jgi:8-oxo-dGTP pyrophosphatase MutT (NUDIX family)
MTYEKSAGAVVVRKADGETEYLLLHYTSGYWDLVKGNIEPGEAEKETVLRELEEETGIRDGKFVEGFREMINYIYKRARKTIYKEVVFYLVATNTGEVRISHEHQGHEWLDYENAHGRLTYGNARKILEKARAYYEVHGGGG